MKDKLNRLGKAVPGEQNPTDQGIELELNAVRDEPAEIHGLGNRLSYWFEQLATVGNPEWWAWPSWPLSAVDRVRPRQRHLDSENPMGTPQAAASQALKTIAPKLTERDSQSPAHFQCRVMLVS